MAVFVLEKGVHMHVRGSMNGTGVLLKWHDCHLHYDADHRMLEGTSDQTRIGLDGHVQSLQDGRLHLTTAQQFATSPYDGWVLDTRSGAFVAWRGMNAMGWEENPVAGVATLLLDGYEVDIYRPELRFGPHRVTWLASRGELPRGEIVLDARQPKSLTRRVRRAKQGGAREVPGSGLLLFERDELVAWPPAPRVRKPRAPSGEGKNHPSNKRW